ncbi:hypothetical protein D3C80_2103740 [compost metagenome]
MSAKTPWRLGTSNAWATKPVATLSFPPLRLMMLYVVISDFQADACLAGWRDSLKWGICVRPGMEPDQGERLWEN